MLDEFGVYLKPSIYGKDVKPFLKDACSQIFGSATGLVDMMVAHIPSSKAGNATKVSNPFCFLLVLVYVIDIPPTKPEITLNKRSLLPLLCCSALSNLTDNRWTPSGSCMTVCEGQLLRA